MDEKEIQTAVVEGEQIQQSAQSEEKVDYVPKKDFYKVYGENKKLMGKVSELEQKLTEFSQKMPQTPEDFGDYSPEDVSFFSQKAEKIAEQIAIKKFNELTSQREKTQLQQKEETAFLSNNPEANEYIEAIYNFKKNIDPNMSLNQAWNVVKSAYGMSQPSRPSASIGGDSGGTPKKEITEAEAHKIFYGLEGIVR